MAKLIADFENGLRVSCAGFGPSGLGRTWAEPQDSLRGEALGRHLLRQLPGAKEALRVRARGVGGMRWPGFHARFSGGCKGDVLRTSNARRYEALEMEGA